MNNQNIINLPPFYIRNKNIQEMKVLRKIFFIFLGKVVGLLANKTEGKLFCLFINKLYKNDGKIFFEKDKYIKETTTNKKIFFPNKRVLRLVNSYKTQLEKFSKTYFIDEVDFNNGDLIIDCGANIGELSLVLDEKNIDFEYIAFEPDIEVFECLKLNNEQHLSNLYNKGLSDKSNKLRNFEAQFESKLKECNSPGDVFKSLIGNNFMGIVESVGEKIQKKMDDGELNERNLIEDAQSLMSMMTGGESLGDLFSMFQGSQSSNKSSKKTSSNTSRKDKQRDRLRKKLEMRKKNKEI